MTYKKLKEEISNKVDEINNLKYRIKANEITDYEEV
jgi:hypothetical protein